MAPQCCLCPVSGGALKPAEGDDLWCHAACMQWIPEVSVKDVTRMEPVCHIKSIQKERWDLMCCICKCAALLPLNRCYIVVCVSRTHVGPNNSTVLVMGLL